MRVVISIFLIISLIFCAESLAESVCTESITNSGKSIEFQNQENKLVGKWIVKKLLVNGKVDLENYPVNDDELTLEANMTAETVDKTFDMVDQGTWQWVNDKFFMVTIQEEKMLFEIMKLTETELETKLLYDELEMKISYIKKR